MSCVIDGVCDRSVIILLKLQDFRAVATLSVRSISLVRRIGLYYSIVCFARNAITYILKQRIACLISVVF